MAISASLTLCNLRTISRSAMSLRVVGASAFFLAPASAPPSGPAYELLMSSDAVIRATLNPGLRNLLIRNEGIMINVLCKF